MFSLFKLLFTAFCCKDLCLHSTTDQVKKDSPRNFLDPHFVKGHGGIVQLFEWKWNDIANECENFLSPRGYGGVQISPPNENVIVVNRPWYERYQPMSYKIITRSGDETQFLDMTKRCNAVGVRIYVDVVFNHMAADQPNQTAIGTGGSTANPRTRDYSAVPFDVTNFHPPCPLVDFNDAVQVRNCELVGLHDLNQTEEDTRGKIVDFLNHLIDLGVAGFRVDAAKHQWPNDLKSMYNRLKNLNTSFGFAEGLDPFIYQEVVDSGNEAVSKYEYIFASVAEFRYSSEITRSFRHEDDLHWLSGFGEKWSLLPSELAVVFVDNHDTQRTPGGTLTYKDRKIYVMAQAFSLAHSYGVKRVMSSFAFEKFNEGPPSDANGNILSPTFDASGNCTNGWVCEHRWPQIAGMVGFMNTVEGENVTAWWDNGANQIAFSLGSKGFIAFNLDPEDMTVKIPTSLLPGTYCDVINGKKVSDNACSGKSLEVSSDGNISVVLTSGDVNGVVAVHIGHKISRI